MTDRLLFPPAKTARIRQQAITVFQHTCAKPSPDFSVSNTKRHLKSDFRLYSNEIRCSNVTNTKERVERFLGQILRCTKNGSKTSNSVFFLSYPVIYNRSLNANNDIMKKNKARKEVAEIAGASGEYTLLV